MPELAVPSVACFRTPLPIAVADQDAVSVEHTLARSDELAYDLASEGLVWMRRGLRIVAMVDRAT